MTSWVWFGICVLQNIVFFFKPNWIWFGFWHWIKCSCTAGSQLALHTLKCNIDAIALLTLCNSLFNQSKLNIASSFSEHKLTKLPQKNWIACDNFKPILFFFLWAGGLSINKDQNVLISRKPYLEQLVENNLKEVSEKIACYTTTKTKTTYPI